MPYLRTLSLCLAGVLAASLHAQQPILATSLPEITTLPDAPSALLLPAAPEPQSITPYAGRGGNIVNGRPYFQPTGREMLHAYEHEVLLGPRPYIHAAIRSTIEQIRDQPPGWGQDFPGYIQRFGSAFGEAAIDHTVRFGLGTLLHEDVRYLICHHCSAWDKIENAALFEVTARHGTDGHRAFSVTPIIASISGPMVAYAAWYPDGAVETPQMALKHVPFGMVTRFLFDTAREFLFDRDTKAEKAAKQSAAATATAP